MGGHMWGFLCCIILFSYSSLFSQTLLQEDFDYSAGDSLVSHGWSAHLSAGINPIRVISPGLVYAGHPGSGTGNAARLYQTGEDVSRAIDGLSDTDVYVSFLVRVQDATTSSSEHFLHFNIGTHVGRVFVKKSGEQIAFGIAKSSEAATFTETVYSLNTNYLVVLRYTHISGNDNDVVRLVVTDSGIPAVEPGATLGPITSVGTEPLAITAVALRQGGSVVSDIVVDGMRVGTSWVEAGLPVTFSSFMAGEIDGDVLLRWRTESEVGNYGFEIERRMMENGRWKMENGDERTSQRTNEITNQRQDESTNQRNDSQFTIHDSPQWLTIGFVQGAGTSSSPREYALVDKPGQPGCYAYRIKQIEHNGTFTYTSTLEVVIGLAPTELTLTQNYPNPFNPTTTVGFFLKNDTKARLSVYDMSGKCVRVLLDKIVQSGWHEIDFDAEGLPSGTYLARIEAGGQIAVRKIVLAK